MTISYTPPLKQVIATNKQITPEQQMNTKVNTVGVGSNVALVDGPIAQQVASALAELYAKEIDESTGIVLETQAIDEQLTDGIWLALKQSGEIKKDTGALYAVQSSSVGLNDIDKFDEAARAMTLPEKENSALLILPSTPVTGTAVTTTMLGQADGPSAYSGVLRKHANKHGVRVFSSLEAYHQHLISSSK